MNRAIRLLMSSFVLFGTIVSNAWDPPTVLITGVNRGLGFAFTQKYIARGWNVIATVGNPEETHNRKAWYDSFSVKLGDRYYLAPDQRVRLWLRRAWGACLQVPVPAGLAGH